MIEDLYPAAVQTIPFTYEEAVEKCFEYNSKFLYSQFGGTAVADYLSGLIISLQTIEDMTVWVGVEYRNDEFIPVDPESNPVFPGITQVPR